VDGTNLRQLTTDMNGACNFDWSPDGRQLVYTSPCTDKSSQYPLGSLYLSDLSGAPAKQLPESRAGDFDPAWSPDGNKIAFTSLRNGSMQIFVYDFTAAALSRLTDSGNNIQSRSPAWSPDGTKIAYTVRRSGLLQIWQMNADGSGKEQLLRTGGSFSDYLPAWSADGQTIYFSEANADLSAPASLMKLVLSTSKVSLMPIPLPVVDVTLSSDGQWLAYEFSDTKNQDIYIYRLPNGPPQQLTKPGLVYFDPAWRPATP
jgi:Tol biopolymer transport system component